MLVFFSLNFSDTILKKNKLLFFVDVPMAVVSFGRSLNPKNILEGADVYFECHVKSNPPFYNITWRNNVSILKWLDLVSLANFNFSIIFFGLRGQRLKFVKDKYLKMT